MLHTMMAKRARHDELTVQTWLTDARRTGVKDGYAGKRRHPRFTWSTQVTVQLTDEDTNETTELRATTRDISVGGLGLKIRQRLDVGALVRVTLDETGESVCGRVRHCGEALGGYYVGLEFVFPANRAPGKATSIGCPILRETKGGGRTGTHINAQSAKAPNSPERNSCGTQTKRPTRVRTRVHALKPVPRFRRVA